MKRAIFCALASAVLFVLSVNVPMSAQPAAADAHVAAAKAAAGSDFSVLYEGLCEQAMSTPETESGRPRRARPPAPPPRASWHAEPVKVFDNLYFVGQTEYSVWAINTSGGIILIDSIFDYSVDDEVAGGLKKLGLDPAAIKYVIVSHGHGDHSGGAKYLQDRFNAHVILGAADWDLLDRSSGTKPRRDMVGADGQALTLGDTTVTMHATPGHTLGTLSMIFPVTDHGVRHVVATWGGTAFNWMGSPSAYVTPERPIRFWFETYSASARRYKEIAASAGADVIISNHTSFDGSTKKLPAIERRKPGEPHPYVMGRDGVQRYLTVVDECAQAGLAHAR
jgi:metallo-beta-lactamase class B